MALASVIACFLASTTLDFSVKTASTSGCSCRQMALVILANSSATSSLETASIRVLTSPQFTLDNGAMGK